jgi:hypothetical protein
MRPIVRLGRPLPVFQSPFRLRDIRAGDKAMSSGHSRLSQSFLGLPDEAFRAVPILEQAIAATINSHLDAHRSSTGTVMTALACVIGEFIVMTGDEAEQNKQWFASIVDAYVSAGMDGARTGPDDQLSLVRRPWKP